MHKFEFPGWHLVGRFESGVGSWLLHHGGEAALLEAPEGMTVVDVSVALQETKTNLKYVLASHDHADHLDPALWHYLSNYFWEVKAVVHPASRPYSLVTRNLTAGYDLGGEPLYQVRAPKHSWSDSVTVFRGVAMTGDVELGTAESDSGEVPRFTREESMRYYAGFQQRTGYRVHTVFSAHMDDLRRGTVWEDLFSFPQRTPRASVGAPGAV